MEGYYRDKNKSNLGGIKSSFIFFGEDEVDYFSDIVENEITRVVFLKSDTTASKIDITQENATFQEEEPEPGFFEYELQVTIPRDSQELSNFLEQFIGRKIITKVVDNNGNSRLIGEPGNGARITSELNKGEQVSDLNAYTLKITWKADHRAPFANNLSVATADFSCSNPQYSDAIEQENFTTSIDIQNNSEFSYPAKQKFYLEDIGTIIQEHTIAALSTRTFTVNFDIPTGPVGKKTLSRSNTCEGTTDIQIKNLARYLGSNCIYANNTFALRIYDKQITNIINYEGTANLVISDNKIVNSSKGTIYNLEVTDGTYNYIFPLAEGFYHIVHDINHGKRAVIGGYTWTKQNNYHHNLYKGTTELDTGNGLIYVPYNNDRNKIYTDL